MNPDDVRVVLLQVEGRETAVVPVDLLARPANALGDDESGETTESASR